MAWYCRLPITVSVASSRDTWLRTCLCVAVLCLWGVPVEPFTMSKNHGRVCCNSPACPGPWLWSPSARGWAFRPWVPLCPFWTNTHNWKAHLCSSLYCQAILTCTQMSVALEGDIQWAPSTVRWWEIVLGDTGALPLPGCQTTIAVSSAGSPIRSQVLASKGWTKVVIEVSISLGCEVHQAIFKTVTLCFMCEISHQRQLKSRTVFGTVSGEKEMCFQRNWPWIHTGDELWRGVYSSLMQNFVLFLVVSFNFW